MNETKILYEYRFQKKKAWGQEDEVNHQIFFWKRKEEFTSPLNKLTYEAQGLTWCLIGPSGEELMQSSKQSLVPNVLLISVNILLALLKKKNEFKQV